MDKTDSKGLVKMFSYMAEGMKENKDYLISLDNQIGDGDLGLTMEKSFAAAYDFAKKNDSLMPSKLIAMAGIQLMNAAPSTMATLMGSGFMRAGKALGDIEDFDGNALKKFFNGFLEGVVLRGKANTGEKTIVDILAPICREIESINDNSIESVAKAAVKGAEVGMENEKSMMSQHGKAAVFREKTLNLTDPGSAAVLIMSKCILKAFEG